MLYYFLIMIPIGQALNVILRFLPASILVERVLEFFSLIFDSLGVFRAKPSILPKVSSIRAAEEPREEARRRSLRKQLILQAMGSVLGIIICWKSNLRIFYLLGFQSGEIAQWLDILLSGILISGGSEPIHSLITFLQKSKEKAKAEAEEAERLLQEVKGEVPKPLIDIDYDGGLYPNKPGHRLRRQNPEYIVYHHTATDSSATFEQIVAIEQEERRDSRGRTYVLDPSYHCVITADGVYHNYCRWDSVGYHVSAGEKVSNENSLGISFVGNFETRKNVKGNNSDGRFGNKRPTPEQLDTGAKVTALWMKLYDIPEDHVLPHKDVKKGHTVCPGSNFPHEEFKRKISSFLQLWDGSPQAQKEIEDFKKREYIYV